MSKAGYAVSNKVNRNIPKGYGVVNGVYRNMKKGYGVVNGVYRLWYDGGKPTLPSAYQALEYIDFSSTASSSLNSGVKSYYAEEISLTAQPLSSNNSPVLGCQHIAAGGSSPLNYLRIDIRPSTNSVYFLVGSPNSYNSCDHSIVVSNISKKLEIYLKKSNQAGTGNIAKVDAITESFSSTGWSASYHVDDIIIGGYTQYSGQSSNPNGGATGDVRIYKCSIKAGQSSSSMVEYNFYPCREKTTGNVGMYETTYGKFIGNSKVIAGPDLT